MFDKINQFFSMEPRPYPNPGTGNFAYVQNTTFPEFDAGGAGRRVYGQLFFEHNNVLTDNVVVQDGFGGLITGQMALQYLLDRNNQ